MSDIQTGAPPSKHRTGETPYDDLARAALANPGEWVNCPIPPGKSTTNHHGAVLRSVSKVWGVQVSRRGERLYVKVPE